MVFKFRNDVLLFRFYLEPVPEHFKQYKCTILSKLEKYNALNEYQELNDKNLAWSAKRKKMDDADPIIFLTKKRRPQT